MTMKLHWLIFVNALISIYAVDTSTDKRRNILQQSAKSAVDAEDVLKAKSSAAAGTYPLWRLKLEKMYKNIDDASEKVADKEKGKEGQEQGKEGKGRKFMKPNEEEQVQEQPAPMPVGEDTMDVVDDTAADSVEVSKDVIRESTQANNRKLRKRLKQSNSKVQAHDKALGLKSSWQRELVGLALFSSALIIFVVWAVYLLHQIKVRYDDASQRIDDLEWTYNSYVYYVFGNWIAWTQNAGMLLLLIVTTIALIVFTFLYWMLVPKSGFWSSAWFTFIWLVAPDGGLDQPTWYGALCGAIVSVTSVLIFAVLLTLVSDMFNVFISGIREGNDQVMEVGHIVIIGLTQTTLTLLDELCEAHALEGGISIVVLLRGLPKEEMTNAIEEADFDLRGSKVILRSGYPQYEADLLRVGANAAKSVIILADHREDKEVRDAFVLQALLVLRSRGWPKDGRILLECSLLQNKDNMDRIGGDRTDIVMVDRWLARLFCQVSQQKGLGEIVQETFSQEGDCLHTMKVPKDLEGHMFSDAAWHFPNAVPIGTIGADGKAILGHSQDRALSVDQDLILLAPREEALCYQVTKFCQTPRQYGRDRAIQSTKKLGTEPEVVIVYGWGALIGPFLVQLDIEVCKGSRIVVVSPKEIAEREDMLKRFERRWNHKFVNTVVNLQGLLGSPTVWQRLPIQIEDASRIFLLADEHAPDARHADACTIAAVVQLRALMKERGVTRDVPIVPEIQDPRTEFLCRVCGISSYVDSSGMPVQVVASVCMAPRLREIMRVLVGSDSEVGYCIHKLEDYLPDGASVPSAISFMAAQKLVSQAGDVLIGWTIETTDFVCESPAELKRSMAITGGGEGSPQKKSSFIGLDADSPPASGRVQQGTGQSQKARRKSQMDQQDSAAAKELAAQFQSDPQESSLNLNWMTNPVDKLSDRRWGPEHRLCVIGFH